MKLDLQTLLMAIALCGNKSGGSAGVSPTIEITETALGHQVTITDVNGVHTFDVDNGLPGTPGVSPRISVSNITGGHRLQIINADQTTTTFDVMNGLAIEGATVSFVGDALTIATT